MRVKIRKALRIFRYNWIKNKKVVKGKSKESDYKILQYTRNVQQTTEKGQTRKAEIIYKQSSSKDIPKVLLILSNELKNKMLKICDIYCMT